MTSGAKYDGYLEKSSIKRNTIKIYTEIYTDKTKAQHAMIPAHLP